MRKTRSQTQAENAASTTPQQSAPAAVNTFDAAKFKVTLSFNVSFNALKHSKNSVF